jgi:hypothetical protein
MGMIGLDIRPTPECAKWSTPVRLLNRTGKNSNANNLVAKAKSVVSPYFGANDFAFAYAKA